MYLINLDLLEKRLNYYGKFYSALVMFRGRFAIGAFHSQNIFEGGLILEDGVFRNFRNNMFFLQEVFSKISYVEFEGVESISFFASLKDFLCVYPNYKWHSFKDKLISKNAFN